MSDWLEAERRVERAQELSESQRWAEALSEIEVALRINPHNALWHAHRGFLLEQLHDHIGAADAYQTSLEIDPADCEVAMALGVCLSQVGRFAKALEVFNRLAERFPEFEPAYCHRIAIYTELGRHQQAEEMFYMAQQLNDECPHCFFHMGRSLAVRGQADQAIFCWKRVLDLEPDYVGVHRCIGQALRSQGRIRQARKHYLIELRDDPGNTDLLCEMAEAALETGRLAEAAGRSRQILELDPDHIEARFVLGKVFLRRDKADRALECFEHICRFLGPRPDLPHFLQKRGEALLKLGKHDEAIACLKTAVEVEEKKQPETYCLLAECYLAAKRFSQATEQFRRAIALEAGHIRSRRGLAICLLEGRDGNPEAALQHLWVVLKNEPNDLPSLYWSAIANVKLGQWRDARESTQRALELKPGDPDFIRLVGTLWRHRLRQGLKRILSPLLSRVR